MKKEILFRGQDYEKDKWIYGYYFEANNEDHYIISLKKNHLGITQTIRVKGKTVTQFTGLYDSTKWEELDESERKQWVLDGYMPSESKGKQIFEGDFLKRDGDKKVNLYDGNLNKSPHWEKIEIGFKKGCFCKRVFAQYNCYFAKMPSPWEPLFYTDPSTYRKIGNKFDNLELLK